MKENENFSKGVRYAIKETYANVHIIKSKVEEIKNKYGEEASEEFLNGYYKGLRFFTHAFDRIQCSDKTINEYAEKYGKDYGQDAKEAFLMGVEYYRNIENDEKSNQNKR